VAQTMGFVIDHVLFASNGLEAMVMMKTGKSILVPPNIAAFSKMNDYTTFGYPIGVYLVSSKPKKHEPYFNLIKPFQPLLWLAILVSGATVLIVGILMSVVRSTLTTLPNFMWNIFGVLCNQSILGEANYNWTVGDDKSLYCRRECFTTWPGSHISFDRVDDLCIGHYFLL
jgi:hypothetical protein